MYKKINPYEILLIESEEAEKKSSKIIGFLKKLVRILTLGPVREKFVKALKNFIILTKDKETYKIIFTLVKEYPTEVIGAFVVTLSIAFSPEIISYVMKDKIQNALGSLIQINPENVLINYVKIGIKVSTLIAAIMIAPKLLKNVAEMRKSKTIKDYNDILALYRRLLEKAQENIKEGQNEEKNPGNNPPKRGKKGSYNLFESLEDEVDMENEGEGVKETIKRLLTNPKLATAGRISYMIAWVLTVFALGFVLLASFINNNYKVTLKTVAVLSALGFSRVL